MPLGEELHSFVAQGRGLHSRAEGLSLGQMHHFAEWGTLPASRAEAEAAAAEAQEALVDQVVLEASGCSEPWMWGASELWEEGALSGRVMAVLEVAAAEEAWGQSMVQMGSSLEGDQGEEMNQAEM